MSEREHIIDWPVAQKAESQATYTLAQGDNAHQPKNSQDSNLKKHNKKRELPRAGPEEQGWGDPFCLLPPRGGGGGKRLSN
jgi:hypothetical protein